jgi:hypothetical protein
MQCFNLFVGDWKLAWPQFIAFLVVDSWLGDTIVQEPACLDQIALSDPSDCPIVIGNGNGNGHWRL